MSDHKNDMAIAQRQLHTGDTLKKLMGFDADDRMYTVHSVEDEVCIVEDMATRSIFGVRWAELVTYYRPLVGEFRIGWVEYEQQLCEHSEESSIVRDRLELGDKVRRHGEADDMIWYTKIIYDGMVRLETAERYHKTVSFAELEHFHRPIDGNTGQAIEWDELHNVVVIEDDEPTELEWLVNRVEILENLVKKLVDDQEPVQAESPPQSSVEHRFSVGNVHTGQFCSPNGFQPRSWVIIDMFITRRGVVRVELMERMAAVDTTTQTHTTPNLFIDAAEFVREWTVD